MKFCKCNTLVRSGAHPVTDIQCYVFTIASMQGWRGYDDPVALLSTVCDCIIRARVFNRDMSLTCTTLDFPRHDITEILLKAELKRLDLHINNGIMARTD